MKSYGMLVMLSLNVLSIYSAEKVSSLQPSEIAKLLNESIKIKSKEALVAALKYQNIKTNEGQDIDNKHEFVTQFGGKTMTIRQIVTFFSTASIVSMMEPSDSENQLQDSNNIKRLLIKNLLPEHIFAQLDGAGYMPGVTGPLSFQL